MASLRRILTVQVDLAGVIPGLVVSAPSQTADDILRQVAALYADRGSGNELHKHINFTMPALGYFAWPT